MAKFGRFLYDKLSMSYAANEATVCHFDVRLEARILILSQLMWMDITLGGRDTDEAHPDLDPSSDSSQHAKSFLKKHLTARIIIVVDTHCLDNGAFVHTGNSPETYVASFLPEVSAFKFNLLMDPQPDKCKVAGGCGTARHSKVCVKRQKHSPPCPQKLDHEPCVWSVGQ